MSRGDRQITRNLVLTSKGLATIAKDESALLVGTWCLAGNPKHGKPDNRERLEILQYHWDARSKYKEDFKYIQSLQSPLIGALADSMNELHRMSLPVEYWRTILAPWTNTVVTVLFDRWEVISTLINSDDLLELKPQLTYDALELPSGYDAAITQYHGDEWNDYIFRLILKCRKQEIGWLKDESIRKRRTPLQTKQPTTKVSPLPPRIKRFLVSFLLRAWGIFSSTSLIDVNFSRLTALRIRRLEHPLWNNYNVGISREIANIPSQSVNSGWRAGRLNVSVSEHHSSFERFLNTEILNLVPWLYVEGFADLKSISSRMPWPRRPKCLITTNGQYSNEPLKVWVAETKLKNPAFRYIIAQHAWGYFFFEADSYKELELRICDIFLGWGAEVSSHFNCINMPTGRIVESARFARSPRNGKIVFSLMSFPIYAYLQRAFPVGSQTYGLAKAYSNFLSNLSPSVFEQLEIRPYPLEYEHAESESLLREFPNLKVDRDQKFERSIGEAKLVVCDAYSSVWIQCLGAGIPVVAIMNLDRFLYLDRYESLVSRLLDSYLLFDNYQEAAKFVNRTDTDIDGWWHNATTQEVRRQMLAGFANVGPDWSKIWRHSLAGILNKSQARP